MNTLLDRNAIALPYTDSMNNLSNKFSNFFDEKMFKLRERSCSTRIADVPSSSVSTDNPTPVPDLSDFKPTDHKEVGEIIRKSPNESCTLDPLPTWLLIENLVFFFSQLLLLL